MLPWGNKKKDFPQFLCVCERERESKRLNVNVHITVQCSVVLPK